MKTDFAVKYGPWAVVAGASEGLGAAFAKALAPLGLKLVLIARRRELLESLALELESLGASQVVIKDGDLAEEGFVGELISYLQNLDVGLVVYNACSAPVGEFIELRFDELESVVKVNILGPLRLLHGVLPHMCERRKGGIILMSSLAGNQGSPNLATYAASKAFLRVLAEGLWCELRSRGVDVLACVAGAIRTPGYQRASTAREAPGTMDPMDVATAALKALGCGPIAVPGITNKVARLIMTRLLPIRLGVRLMGGSTRKLGGS